MSCCDCDGVWVRGVVKKGGEFIVKVSGGVMRKEAKISQRDIKINDNRSRDREIYQ
jgi:hypothetical protein